MSQKFETEIVIAFDGEHSKQLLSLIQKYFDEVKSECAVSVIALPVLKEHLGISGRHESFFTSKKWKFSEIMSILERDLILKEKVINEFSLEVLKAQPKRDYQLTIHFCMVVLRSNELAFWEKIKRISSMLTYNV